MLDFLLENGRENSLPCRSCWSLFENWILRLVSLSFIGASRSISGHQTGRCRRRKVCQARSSGVVGSQQLSPSEKEPYWPILPGLTRNFHRQICIFLPFSFHSRSTPIRSHTFTWYLHPLLFLVKEITEKYENAFKRNRHLFRIF